MAKGENAAKHWAREYWSRRHPSHCLPWGRWGKLFTHRRERRQARAEAERRLKEDLDA